MAQTQSSSEPVVDGRRLRRERGRQAVIDAMIDLVLDGHVPPSAEQVTARAGVSQASLFRYFGTLDELRHEAIGRYFERFDDLLAVPDIGEGSVVDRIERFVTARDAWYHTTAPVARLTRRQSADVTDFAETIERLRTTFADQVRQHFASELEGFDPRTREQRVAVVAALTSFEAWDQLASLGDVDRRQALHDALTSVLDVAG